MSILETYLLGRIRISRELCSGTSSLYHSMMGGGSPPALHRRFRVEPTSSLVLLGRSLPVGPSPEAEISPVFILNTTILNTFYIDALT